MNRRFVAGIAGLAILLAVSIDVQESHALGRNKCCGAETTCGGGGLFGGGLFKGRSCGGRDRDRGCGGGLLAKRKAKKADCGCDPCATSCCEPEPCCAPVSCCEPTPCCAPEPCCGGCGEVVSSCGCGGCGGCSTGCGGCSTGCGGCGTVAGCANCSQTMDSGTIVTEPAEAPPAPTPDAAADSASDAPSA